MKYKYNGSIMDERMEVFLESFLPDLPPYLEEIACVSEENHVPIIRQQTRKLLSFIIKTRNISLILEIGTAIGYSSLCMAYDNDVKIDTMRKCITE
ncbi:MAG: hypothetical protein E7267_00280 [Lachnospiraceae bacterium]|nr:hypothetical protein [Lachnospiraceae bacterium]